MTELGPRLGAAHRLAHSVECPGSLVQPLALGECGLALQPQIRRSLHHGLLRLSDPSAHQVHVKWRSS